MYTLDQAVTFLAKAQTLYDTSEELDGNAHYRSMSEMYFKWAAAYAAVAQAEALKGIADELNAITNHLDNIEEQIGILVQKASTPPKGA